MVAVPGMIASRWRHGVITVALLLAAASCEAQAIQPVGNSTRSGGVAHHRRNRGRLHFHIAAAATGDAWFNYLAIPNKVAYAMLHQYDISIAKKPIPTDETRRGGWHKIPHARDVMQTIVQRQRYTSLDTWVLVMDSDAFFMDMNIPLDTIVMAARNSHAPGKPLDVIAAEDCNMINSGVFMVRASQWGLFFLDAVWQSNSTNIYMITDWWDQAALKHFIDNGPGVRERVCYLPKRMINAYPPLNFFKGQACWGIYQPGDFILHFAGGSKELLTDFKDQIQNATQSVLSLRGSNTSRWE